MNEFNPTHTDSGWTYHVKRWIPTLIMLPIMIWLIMNHGKYTWIDNADLVIHEPTAFFSKEVHENCPLEENDDVYAPSFSQPGCLRRLGCRGPITKADCPTRLWNNRTSFCITGPIVGGQELYPAGAPCIGCTEPGFPDPPFSPFYKQGPGDD